MTSAPPVPPPELPDHIAKVHVRCGSPVTVTDYATCPVHGRLQAPEVVSRAYWLALEGSVSRHPAGKKR